MSLLDGRALAGVGGGDVMMETLNPKPSKGGGDVTMDVVDVLGIRRRRQRRRHQRPRACAVAWPKIICLLHLRRHRFKGAAFGQEGVRFKGFDGQEGADVYTLAVESRRWMISSFYTRDASGEEHTGTETLMQSP